MKADWSVNPQEGVGTPDVVSKRIHTEDFFFPLIFSIKDNGPFKAKRLTVQGGVYSTHKGER